MRMLTVIPAMGIGGAEAVAETLVRAAHNRGDAARLASDAGFRAEAVVTSGIPHVRVPLTGRRPADLALTVAILRSSSRGETPDLVHAHNVKAALVARLSFPRPVPVLTTLHGVPEAELSMAARLLRWSSDRVAAVSPHVAQQLVRHGFPQERVSVVENSMPPLRVHPREESRARLGLDGRRPVVLCLARMVPQKRHDLLLEAWARLDHEAVLLLAGDGPTRPAIERTVDELALRKSVRVLGQRTDADRLISAADVVVLPTDWEGLPISLLEAMAAGVPVIVSRVGGVVETLGEALHLVEPGSAAALAAALSELLGDEVRRESLGRRGRALVAQRFAPERMLAGYDDLYRAMAPVLEGSRL